MLRNNRMSNVYVALKSVIKVMLFSNVNLYMFLVCFKVECNLKSISFKRPQGDSGSPQGGNGMSDSRIPRTIMELPL